MVKNHQEAELRGVEEYAIECSILKVAVSEDAQNCADQGIQYSAVWVIQQKLQWNLHGEMQE